MAVGDARVFPGFLTPVLTQISFQSHRLLFSHASAEVRSENTPERNFASPGSQTPNHQVMSPTRSPLSHLGEEVMAWTSNQGALTQKLKVAKFRFFCTAPFHNLIYQSMKFFRVNVNKE